MGAPLGNKYAEENHGGRPMDLSIDEFLQEADRLRHQVEKVVDDDTSLEMYESTGYVDPVNGHLLLLSMVKALNLESSTREEHVSHLNRLGGLLREFAPKDAIEGMLASQAIVCNEKAMEYIKCASYQITHHQWMATYSNAASKLMVRTQSALQMLISYRRGGQQKIVVEHVNIAPGGQAAFGHFEVPQREDGGSKENHGTTP